MTEEQKPNGVPLEEQEETVTISLEEAMEMGLLDGLVDAPKNLRHTVIFDDGISTESVQELINTLGNYTKVDLFFSTPGGAMVAMEALIHYLNTRKDDITITLTDEICSAGTFLLTDFEGCIKLSKGLDFILFHLGDRLSYSNRKDEVSKKELLKQLKTLNEEWAEKFTALGLTPKEIKRYKSGYNVILYQKDFPRLNIKCNDAE